MAGIEVSGGLERRFVERCCDDSIDPLLLCEIGSQDHRIVRSLSTLGVAAGWFCLSGIRAGFQAGQGGLIAAGLFRIVNRYDGDFSPKKVYRSLQNFGVADDEWSALRVDFRRMPRFDDGFGPHSRGITRGDG
jgi:hypothetical protein